MRDAFAPGPGDPMVGGGNNASALSASEVSVDDVKCVSGALIGFL